jgi:hypothetical protein
MKPRAKHLEEHITVTFLPYINHVTYKISRLLTKLNKNYSSPVSNTYPHAEISILKLPIVYFISCGCGQTRQI